MYVLKNIILFEKLSTAVQWQKKKTITIQNNKNQTSLIHLTRINERFFFLFPQNVCTISADEYVLQNEKKDSDETMQTKFSTPTSRWAGHVARVRGVGLNGQCRSPNL